MKPTKSEIYEIAAELEQGIERTGVTSPFMEALIQAAALLKEMDSDYENGIIAVTNYRPPSSCTHDGANTLNEIRAYGDKLIEQHNKLTKENHE